jgi:hypothetical protein
MTEKIKNIFIKILLKTFNTIAEVTPMYKKEGSEYFKDATIFYR